MFAQFKSLQYHNELLEILFKNKSGFFASNIATPVVLSYILYDFISFTLLLSLIIPLFIMGYLRYFISKQALIALKNDNQKEVQNLLKQILFVIFMSSTLIGCSAYLAFLHATPITASFLITFMFVLLAGSISTLTCIFHAYVLFNIPILFIILLGVFQLDGTIYLITSAILIIYAIITIPTSYRIYESLKTNIEKNILIQEQQEQLLANQAYLLESEKMASLGEMIGNIAHQWRQPLSAISVSATAALVEKQMGILSDDEFEKKMTRINDQAQYLSQTIDTFRNFIKDEKVLQEFSLQENIKTAIDIVSSTIKDNHIEMITDIPEDQIKVHIIAGELPQVIINIINNAKDILIEKEITHPSITLHLYENDTHAFISIEDNGGGIPSEVLPKIFEPYFTTKHQSKGTGLGLHMSYNIIQNLHGTIDVTNTTEGAKFIISLPKGTT